MFKKFKACILSTLDFINECLIKVNSILTELAKAKILSKEVFAY